MVVCRKSQNGHEPHLSPPSAQARGGRTQRGGPVFVPRRKPSPLAEALLNQPPVASERVTAYDERWFQGRPCV